MAPEQIAQEGAIQIFREVGGGMEEVVVGVVGVLQLEVLEYRLNTELPPKAPLPCKKTWRAATKAKCRDCFST